MTSHLIRAHSLSLQAQVEVFSQAVSTANTCKNMMEESNKEEVQTDQILSDEEGQGAKKGNLVNV